jgi:hypothetical protein
MLTEDVMVTKKKLQVGRARSLSDWSIPIIFLQVQKFKRCDA